MLDDKSAQSAISNSKKNWERSMPVCLRTIWNWEKIDIDEQREEFNKKINDS